MKNNLFILGAFLCTALFVTSCTDDNKDDDENEGKASIIVGINMQPQADMGYIVPIQDMKAGTMSFANAVETKITPYLFLPKTSRPDPPLSDGPGYSSGTDF